MIDIHCHILYGLDDGARDLEESVEMARMASEDGVRHLFATPHFNRTFLIDRKTVDRRTASLQETLDRLHIPLNIYPGNEVRIENPDFVYDHARESRFAYLGRKHKFVLLEQRWQDFEEKSIELIQWFVRQKIRPIIPHPERHYFFRDDPQLLEDLVKAGAWTQVSADSLVGNNADDALQFCKWLCERDLVHTLATDAHNVRRKPNLSEGYRVVKEWAGETRIREIRARMDTLLE